MTKQRKRRFGKRLGRKATVYAKESKVLRLSPEVNDELKSISHANESYDNVLRRLLGLPARKYGKEASATLFAINDGTHLFTDEAIARGEAIKLAVKNKQKAPAPVVKVRTCLLYTSPSPRD